MTSPSLQSVGVGSILVGGFMLRQVAVGRATKLRTDGKDLVAAVFRGDTAALSQVVARRGTNLPDANAVGGTAAAGAQNVAQTFAAAQGSTLLVEMQRLAAIANHKYVYGAVGPTAYDCSGLVWRACLNLGYYSGPRFTTQSFPSIVGGWAVRVTDAAQVGDIVVWPTKPGHMGVVFGSDTMYSALNTREGIVTSPISSITGEPAQYYRLTMQNNSTASAIRGKAVAQ